MKFKKRPRVHLTREQVVARRRKNIFLFIFSILVAVVTFIVRGDFIGTIVALFVALFAGFMVFHFMDSFKETARVRKIEAVFPDFLQLVASNLRAGMTVDRAMLLSSRPEFAPLDKEILQTGKDISTGKPIDLALKAMSERINSEKVSKTFTIILSGIRAGGDLAILLEETASSTRQRAFIEKKAGSQVLMYVIFIFLAVAIFAPGLFSLSGVLVETMTNLMGDTAPEDVPQNLPVSFNEIKISETFIFYFSITFIVMMNLMASLVLGLVNKGSSKEGLKFFPLMLFLSLSIFFILGKVLSAVMSSIS